MNSADVYSSTFMVVYGVNGEPLILSLELNLLGTELSDVETDTEHLGAVAGVVEHVADVHLFH